MQSSSSCEDIDDDDVCAVCLDRLCDVAAQGMPSLFIHFIADIFYCLESWQMGGSV
jgi:hypothetical protein